MDRSAPRLRDWCEGACLAGCMGMLMVGCGQAYEPLGDEEGVDDPETVQLGTLDQAITSGVLVTTGQNNTAPYNSVVRIQFSGGNPCTATKISNTRYLTAAHCFDDWDGASFRISSALDARTMPTASVANVYTHPSYASRLGTTETKSYDVGIVELTTTGPGTVLAGGINSTYLGPTSGMLWIAYGEDLRDNIVDRAGIKQRNCASSESKATFDSLRPGVNNGAEFARYIPMIETVTYRPCADDEDLSSTFVDVDGGSGGDSGSAMLTSNGTAWSIRGVLARGFGHTFGTDNRANTDDDIGFTLFTRAGNVRLWVSSTNAGPYKLNPIAHNAQGFLQNRAQQRCAAIGSGATKLFECDGRNQPNDDQYWTLQLQATVSGVPYFRIRNNFTSQCLNYTAADIVPATCSTSTKQQWALGTESGSGPTRLRIYPRDFNFAQCLAANPAGPESPLRRGTCAFPDSTQLWHFYP